MVHDALPPRKPGYPLRRSRREWLRLSALLGLGAFAAGCSVPAPAAPAPAPAPAGPAASSAAAPAIASPAAAPASVSVASTAAGALRRAGTLRVAIIGEPPSLDPTVTTASLSFNLAQHYYEGLFARDAHFQPIPMLAEKHEVGEGGRVHTIAIRRGVKFHNGQPLTSADVVASLERFGEAAGRGRDLFRRVENVEARGDHTVVIACKEPTGALPIYLAGPDAIIHPAEIARAAGKDAARERIGTGPFRLAEHLPDRYIRLVRYDDYAALPGEPDGIGGGKAAYLDEIRCIPVPEESVRADGLSSGEYHFAESLSFDNYDGLRAQPGVEVHIVKPYMHYCIIFNKKEGVFSDLRARQAAVKAISVEPLMLAAFARPEFFRLDPAMASPESAFFSTVGEEVYNHPDPAGARRLLGEIGYAGQPVKLLSTKEYGWNYNLALGLKSQFEAVGFTVDLQVTDWATLLSRRNNPSLWDGFCTGFGGYSHPISQTYLPAAYPGGWVSEARDRLIGQLMAEPDPVKQKELVVQLQRVIWEELPLAKIGEGFALRASSRQLKGYRNFVDWTFWNCSLDP